MPKRIVITGTSGNAAHRGAAHRSVAAVIGHGSVVMVPAVSSSV